MTLTTTTIGYPYIGENREWKKTLEAFWKGDLSEQQFSQQLTEIRLHNLEKQIQQGLDVVTVGDFTKYDRMLDTAVMFGLVPNRFNWTADQVDLQTYYSIARGNDDAVASEMTKWFNTNYHYIVPEFEGNAPKLTENKVLEYFIEAKEQFGVIAKPTFIGPFTFSQLTKGYDRTTQVAFLNKLIPLYAQVIQELVDAGAEWIQVEEPSLVLDLTTEDVQLVKDIYTQLSQLVPSANLLLQTYFEALSSYEELIQLPVQGFGLDFVHGKEANLAAIRQYGFPEGKALAAGVINGRNIWRANLEDVGALVKEIQEASNAQLIFVQASCSLQHSPITTKHETTLEPVLKDALSFADEKLAEVIATKQAVNGEEVALVTESVEAIAALKAHASRNNAEVAKELAAITEQHFERHSAFKERFDIQQKVFNFPLFPTTTIGSFPQSAEVKRTRSLWRKHEISDVDYKKFVQKETARWVKIQEDLGLDVLVHGEFERTDMVEYFGEKLAGFAFTKNGWVVSYGSRCVKPPVLYGDVSLPAPMTVEDTAYAQSLTDRPMKGMLTGPATILNWSFVRNDIGRKDVAYQVGLALRKEVEALEAAKITVIQVDEPALREGLPLRQEKRADYLEWAVNAFRLCTASVQDETQIHTHMCYSEFNDFLEPIDALDADVISIETSRSHGEFIDSLKGGKYDKGIGLGVYDIHSPRVPPIEEMTTIMEDSLEVLTKEQFWVNPDCGLKTRKEPETVAALKNMVDAAKTFREKVQA